MCEKSSINTSGSPTYLTTSSLPDDEVIGPIIRDMIANAQTKGDRRATATFIHSLTGAGSQNGCVPPGTVAHGFTLMIDLLP